MCRRVVVAAALALLIVGDRGVAAAQSSERLSNAAAATAAAHERWQAAVAVNRARVARRTELPVVAVVGTLAIHADTPRVPMRAIALLDSVLQDARAAARRVVGAVADSVLAQIAVYADPGYAEPYLREHGMNVRIGSPASRTQSYHHTDVDRPDFAPVARSLLAYVASGASARASALRSWVTNPVSIEPYPSLAYEGFYLILAVTPSASGRACIDGVLGACRTALGLFDHPDSLGAWFTAEQRMALALATTRDSGEVAEVRARCVRGDDAACRSLLSGVGVRSPTSALARRALVRLALTTGGVGAFDRLIAADGASVASRLESAAGVPLDSLLAEWQRTVLRGQPRPPAPVPAEWVGCLVVGALALAASAGRRP